jgi:hypothetical protein
VVLKDVHILMLLNSCLLILVSLLVGVYAKVVQFCLLYGGVLWSGLCSLLYMWSSSCCIILFLYVAVFGFC